MAEEVLRRLQREAEALQRAREPLGEPGVSIPVAVSARHAHVSRTVLEKLYGEGYTLTKYRDLGQPGQFAAEETVTLVGRSLRAIEGVRILGPVRTYTQVELSRADAVRLGIDPPIRCSGDLAGSAPVTLVGPHGAVSLKEGSIRATRHLHMTPRDAEQHRVAHGELVRVRFSCPAALVLENVLVNVSPDAALELHLDTDNAGAADVRGPMMVSILR
ncbi:phosphate propanoyltransferase [bacterium]|nr:phosphate propanoyltransferase [bacterium]